VAKCRAPPIVHVTNALDTFVTHNQLPPVRHQLRTRTPSSAFWSLDWPPRNDSRIPVDFSRGLLFLGSPQNVSLCCTPCAQRLSPAPQARQGNDHVCTKAPLKPRLRGTGSACVDTTQVLLCGKPDLAHLTCAGVRGTNAACTRYALAASCAPWSPWPPSWHWGRPEHVQRTVTVSASSHFKVQQACISQLRAGRLHEESRRAAP